MRFVDARLRAATALAGAALIAACGGGGAQPLPAPPPVQSPAPTPSPTPTPTPAGINYNSAEYQRSSGAAHMNAITAYDRGATGQGVTIAVLDSGVDTDNPEFAGRIHSASQDVAGSRGIDDQSGHGTSVSGVLLAAKNDVGMHGAAFGSTLLALRTDAPGSCDDEDGCQHNDNSLARAIDVAAANGARLINMSLGGSAANSTLRAAIGRATRAGIVVVISAGNKPDDEPAASPNPDPLAQVALDPTAANGLVLIAGSVGTAASSTEISTFSNRAGIGAQQYLAALGYRVRSFDETGTPLLYSGTSYAAPNVAGALALLLSAFPNISGAQAIDILFRSADDAGDPGADAVFGRGILNLTRAFQPIGQASLAGGGAPVATTASNGSLGGALGDAGKLGSSLGGAVILDGFDRAFTVDLAQSIAAAPAQRPLAGRLVDRSRGVSAGDDKRFLYLNLTPATSARPWVGLAQIGVDAHAADRVRARHGFIASEIDAQTRAGLAFGYGAETLLGSMTGGSPDGAFITGSNPLTDAGFARRNGASAAMTRRAGSWTFGLAASHAETGDPRRGLFEPDREGDVDTVALEASRRLGPVALTFGLGRMRESDTVLGSWSGPALGLDGATTRFASVDARLPLGGGVSAGFGARHGWTDAKLGQGLIQDVSGLRSFGFQFDVAKEGVLGSYDRLNVRVAQPLRVSGGAARLNVPVGYDYSTLVTSFDRRTAGLAPSGREIDVEAAYGVGLAGGELGAHLFWRSEPGHIAGRSNDLGAALRFSLGF